MAGISSKAAGSLENKKKYNGIEFENDLDLNVYDAQFRELDAQTGRWWQIDPKTDEMFMWSTYASNYDNPIRYQDPLGDVPECCWEEFKAAVVESVDQVMASASGIVFGALNTVSGGLISTDPFNVRPALSSTTQQFMDRGTDFGKVLPFFTPGTNSSPKGGIVELAPVGAGPKIKIITPSAPVITPPATVNSTKKDRVVDQKPGEKAQNQKEGIEKAQDKAKKEAPQGEKQNKIKSDKKSEQNLKKELKNVKSLNDAKENF
jgi:RHS repeat-associated protein